MTKRQGRGLLVLWGMISVGLALLGPFGTFDLLGPFARAVYWSFVTGASLLLWVGLGRVLRRRYPAPSGLMRAASAIVYALCLGGVLALVHLAVFPGWNAVGGFVWLFTIILAVQAVIHGIIAALRLLTPRMADPADTDMTTQFLARLPLEKRGMLIRLEAEDHYIRVRTTKGEELVLLRLTDAEKELGDTGWRVHRSHWVARDAVSGRRNANGQTLLQTMDGGEVPVGRSYRAALKAAGVL